MTKFICKKCDLEYDYCKCKNRAERFFKMLVATGTYGHYPGIPILRGD